MDTQAIFGLQFVLSLILWSLIAQWLITPWLKNKSLDDALFFLTLPHAFRYIGMVFLVPGVVSKSMPSSFANLAGYGDLATAVLAIFALIAIKKRWSMAVAMVWLFNIVGFADLLNALPRQVAVTHFAAAWYIPTFIVPLLLVTHLIMFRLLILHRMGGNDEA